MSETMPEYKPSLLPPDEGTKTTDETQPNPREYLVGPGVTADLKNRFNYHAPNIEQRRRYTLMRREILNTAKKIVLWTPASREQSLALTKLEEAMFWANAAIARNE